MTAPTQRFADLATAVRPVFPVPRLLSTSSSGGQDMLSAILGLALVGAAAMGTSAQAANPSNEQSLVQPVYWDGGYCGLRCQEHRWWRHQRWEASSLLASPPVAWAFLRLLRAAKILRLLRAALLEPIAFCFEGLPLRRRQLREWLGMICSSAC